MSRQKVPTALRLANEAADISEARARMEVADACAEEARTRAAIARTKRKLVWVYVLGGLIAAVLGIPALATFGKMALQAFRG